MAAAKPLPSSLQALCLGLALLHLLVGASQAQAPAPAPTSGATQATTDPIEERALNAIFRRWNLRASGWNLSGELCSGVATDTSDFDNGIYNPTIKCDCSFDGGTTCRITRLKIYALNVVGPVPQELQNLTYLTNLDLRQNYLTGPLPAFIGNLTYMQYMSVGINALSGSLPKELGNLRNLVSLGMGSNNFSGSLPPELESLTSLEQLYMDSAGVSGEIPSSFSKLRKLKILWASDNGFTGRIPDFIGTAWRNLTVLRLQGNSFQGPIPSSLANLTLLTDLRIGDILNVSSSLDFIRNMNSLATLVIRNSRISDSIPLSFGQYTRLQLLDLSFNNLTGQLPVSLFNLSLLQYLFLGNNSLSGGLPAQKSSSLQNIDLSYNQLSGAFPTWVSQQNLQLNLVANNFVLDDSNSSVMPSGFECLQRNVPCYRGSPIYNSFGVNCGGSRVITASDGIAYEVNNQSLTTASYYVTDTRKWGVSSIGRFADAQNPSYTLSVPNQFQNTLDTELFQTARLSPSSLRYYGLGLENGNYTIKLQFAETAFPDTSTWQSVGRRVFDIYIQGVLREKDFDIRKEAGGSFQAVVRNYQAPITTNFLEIHFFWAGKGTCCIPTQGYYGPAVSAVSISPNFESTLSNQPRSSGKKNTALVVGLVVGVAAFCFCLVFLIYIWRERRKRPSWHDDEELLGISSRADMFSYAELRTATEDFSPANKLGEGGFGPVFKGKLSDGRVVAVKQLSVASNQGKRQFVTEISTISAVQHKNLVKLYGCCVEGDKRLLVYEYLENKSLDQALFGKQKLHLDWPTRFEICLSTARGLAYLHEESRVRIVHRDVKASNILLDSDLNPKISDFGLAKLYDDKKTHISTRVAGTIGYLAPEYAMRGHLTEKADVFGFGVVALEILSGRPNSDTNLPQEKVYLLEWAWHLHERNCELEMVDPTLPSYSKDEALRMIGVALLCTQSSPMQRPSMSRVVAMLAGDIEVGSVTSKPGYLTDWQFNDISNTFASGDSFSSSSFPHTANSSQVHMPSHPSSGASPPPSPKPAEPMLHEVITDGR